MEGECGFIYEIKKDKPVELIDLTNSLFGVADEYRRFLIREGGPPAADGVKLYVKKISSSDIIAELVTDCAGLLPIISYSKNVCDFAKYIKTALDFFLGRAKEGVELEKTNYENLNNILEPVAKDKASQLNITPVVNGDLNFNISINVNSIEANAAQNEIRKKLESLKEPMVGYHKKVLLYWYQARKDMKSAAGDRAIVENIYGAPVKVIMDEDVKADMLGVSENPFKMAYIVDVEVQTIRNKPTIYKIVRLHDKFRQDQGNQMNVFDK